MTLRTPTPASPTRRGPGCTTGTARPLLPASAASAATPGYVQRMPQGDTQVMQHADPVKYQATRFDQYFRRG